MNIAICYSPDWAQYVAIEVFAIQKTNPGAKVYLISDTAGRLDIPGCFFIDVEELFRQRIPSTVNIDGRFTRYTLYRLLLPEIITDPQVLYVDADAIINGDLQELWDTGLQGKLIAGVPDIGIRPSQLAEIGLQPGDVYVNAGVLLMDLTGIRMSGLPDLWLWEINSKNYSCHDQHVLNKTCHGQIGAVGNEYNSSLSTGFAVAPKIMHWAGPVHVKPWVNHEVRNYEIWKGWADKYADSKVNPLCLVRG